jgi:hypothetical protein
MKLYLLALHFFFFSLSALAQADPHNFVKIYDAKGRTIPFVLVKKPLIEQANDRINICATDKNGNMLQLNQLDLRNPKLQKSVLKNARLVYIDMKNNKTYTVAASAWRNPVTWTCKTCKTDDKLTVKIKEKVYINHTYYTIEAGFENIIPQPTYLTTDKIKH